MPRLPLLATVAISALTLGACDFDRRIRLSEDDGARTPFRAVTQLECPDHQGPLTRIRTSPDGQSCVYAGPKGAEVTLRLVKLDDSDSDRVLARLERELNALLPQVADRIAKAHAEEERAEAEARRAEAEAEKVEAEAEKAEQAVERAEMEVERAQALAEKARALAEGDRAEADRAQAEADRIAQRLAELGRERPRTAGDAAPDRAKDDSERVNVSIPGMRVRTEGDNADISMPFIRVRAEGDKADVRVGPISIKADDSSGNVNVSDDDTEMSVRADDDAAEIRTRRRGPGVRASYILVDEHASGGAWRLVGYEARGPDGGPLVIAVVKAKDRREDDVFDAAKDLVKRNAGG